MEKTCKTVQRIKGNFTRRQPPRLSNVSGVEAQKPNETSSIFGEAFASVSETENAPTIFNVLGEPKNFYQQKLKTIQYKIIWRNFEPCTDKN